MQVFSPNFRSVANVRRLTKSSAIGTALTSGFRIALISLIPLSIMACNRPRQIKNISRNLKESVVLISYGNAAGHQTGFLIDGNENSCAVLTAAHGLQQAPEIRLTTHDQEWFEATSVERAKDADLAVIRFQEQNGRACSYPSIEMGNSHNVNIGDTVHIAGYPERAGADQILFQFTSGPVTNVLALPLPQGYAISYDLTAVGGMSGGPVVNTAGKVIAVHGTTDSEIVSLGRNQQNSLSEEQLAEIASADNRVAEKVRINHFKWGIPIQTFHRNRNALLPKHLKGNKGFLSGLFGRNSEDGLPDALVQAKASIATRNYEDAVIWLEQVPVEAQTDEYKRLKMEVDVARSQTSQANREILNQAIATLNEARLEARVNVASDFSRAIAIANQIQPNQPLYDEAQGYILRWGEVILDLAKSRAQSGEYEKAIATVNLIEEDLPRLYPKAQQLLADWQEVVEFDDSSRSIIDGAKADIIRFPDQAFPYNRGIGKLRNIGPDDSLYGEAQRLINEWSQQILDIATNRAQQGDLQLAINTAKYIPQDTSAYQNALDAIERWSQ